MKLFINKTLLFFFILLVITISYGGYYYITFKRINKKETKESIYIWGDSQAKAGFNIILLKKLTNYEVYSSALGGTGAFDFLAFTEAVPKNSSVIFSISPLSLLRERDKNQTGIPVLSLPYLVSRKYPDILYSIRLNIKPKHIFYIENHLYPYRDTLTYHEPLSKFKDIYKLKNKTFVTKELAYLYGIGRLLDKNCKVIFVGFPIHKNLDKIVPLDAKNDYVSFLNKIEKELNISKIDTLYFTNQKRNMYDLTHLNEKGANDFTLQLSDYFKGNETSNRFIIINGGVSE